MEKDASPLSCPRINKIILLEDSTSQEVTVDWVYACGVTIYDYVAATALIVAIGVNSLSVYLQKTRRIYDRFGARAFDRHRMLITFFWGLFIVSEFMLTRSSWRLGQTYVPLGLLFMASGLVVFVAAIRQIGFPALANGNFFGYPLRKLKGIYLYTSNPIYWSYVLWFTGLGFVTSLKSFFVFAALSIIGLIGIESKIETP